MAWKEIGVVDQRARFVFKTFAPGACMSELCREFGISRKTGYKWVSRYNSHGHSGLQDLSRRPATCPTQISTEVALEIVRVRYEHPSWGSPKIRKVLERRGIDDVPSERSIDRVLARSGLLCERKRRRRAPRPPEREVPVPAEPNDLWTVDFKGWWRTRDSQRCEPLTIRDAYSRYVLKVQVVSSTDVQSTKEVFEEAFERYGLPKAIVSDNGSPFACTRSLGGLTRLSAYWVALGITPYRITPGKPQENGGHERMHRDIKAEIQCSPCADRRSQQEAIDQWCDVFNYERPHEALDMKTPAEVYRSSGRKYRGERPVVTYPAHFDVRRVWGSGSIKYKQRPRFISESLASWDIGIEHTSGQLRIWFSTMLLGTTDQDFDGPVDPAA